MPFATKIAPTPHEEIVTKYEKLVAGYHSGITESLSFRKEQLRNLYFAIKDNQAQLKDALFQDLHRPSAETDALELFEVYTEINLALSNLESWSSDTHLAGDMRLLMSNPLLRKTPYGTVLIISPWNYPYLLSIVPIVSAIAAGNTVLFKPTEVAPASSTYLGELLTKTLSPDIFQVVQGAVPETTLILEQKFDKIMFTGSTSVGRIVAQAATKHLTPVALELGGKSPVIVTAKANIKLAAKRIAWGKFTNAGQTCIAPDYMLVEEAVHDQLIAELVKATKAFYGDLTKDSKDYAHIVNERLWERQGKLVEASKGKIELQLGTPDKASRFYPPTIVSQVTFEDELMQDELFGPILPIVKIKSAVKEVPQLVRKHDHPLALYIFTSSDAEAQVLLNKTRSGGAIVNDTLIHGGSAAVPFGGVGTSGVGRYHGKFGFDEFTYERPVLFQRDVAEMALALRYPPFSADKLSKLRFFSVPREWFPRKGPVKGLVGRLFS